MDLIWILERRVQFSGGVRVRMGGERKLPLTPECKNWQKVRECEGKRTAREREIVRLGVREREREREIWRNSKMNRFRQKRYMEI